jgi:hypothetical protein
MRARDPGVVRPRVVVRVMVKRLLTGVRPWVPGVTVWARIRGVFGLCSRV